MHPFIDAVVAFVQANQAWAAPVAFLLAFGESLAFVSLFLPATVILVTIGGLLGRERHRRLDRSSSLPGSAASLGYAVSYWIGLYFKDSDHQLSGRSATTRTMMQRGETFFEKYGDLRRLPRPLLRARSAPSSRSSPAWPRCRRSRFRSPTSRPRSSGRPASSRRASTASSG